MRVFDALTTTNGRDGVTFPNESVAMESWTTGLTSTQSLSNPPTMPHNLNHDTHSYISISFSPSSSFFASPSSLDNLYPGLSYLGQVGELSDVHLYSMPKDMWLTARDSVIDGLKNDRDVAFVEEQIPRQRVKRGGDEL